MARDATDVCVVCGSMCALRGRASLHWHVRERDAVSESEGCTDDEEHDADRGF